MEQRTFTDRYLQALKAKETPYKLAEQAPRGEGRLLVRVLPTGAKECFYRYRTDGKDKTIALGRYDQRGTNGKTLADIRASCRVKRKLQEQTGDIKEHIAAEKHAREINRRKGSFGQLLDAYIESLEAAGKPSAAQAKGTFKRNVSKPFPEIVALKANGVEPGHIQTILARMVRAGIEREVNVVRSYLQAAFTFGGRADNDPRTVARDGVLFGLKTNPVILVPRIAEYEKTGERVLSEDELKAYWEALDALPTVQRATLRLNLAIGGQRIKQLLRADAQAFDFAERTLLIKDAKGRGKARDHLVPLNNFALVQLEPMLKRNADAPTLFTADGKRTMVLDTLSKAVAEVSATLTEKQNIPPFDLRALRRTCETMLQKLGIPREVRAHMLSHGREGVQGKHYERHDFIDEKWAAFNKWTAHVERVLDPSIKAQVVQLRGKAA